MTSSELFKNAFIAELCGHPSAAAYRRKLTLDGHDADTLDAKIKKAGKTVSKSDILAENSQHGFFLNHPQSWSNFERVAKFVAKKGEPFTADDLLSEVAHGSKSTYLESAVNNKALKTLFTPEIWQGRYDEVERLYYNINIGTRRKLTAEFDIKDIKRKIFELDGLKTREDMLSGMNIDSDDFPRMFQHGGISRLRSVAEKLERHGMHLTKEDIFFADEQGDNMFYYASAWKNFDEIVEMVSKGGERFEVEDFFKQNGNRPSVLKRAQENGAMDKVFTPAIWEGRLTEMMGLWSRLKPIEKQEVGLDEFAHIVEAAEDKMYGNLLSIDKNLKASDLTKPIAIEGKVHVYPLALASTWDNWDKIQNQLKENGETIKLSDLRKKSGYMNRPLLETAIHNGHLNKIVDLLIETKQSFQVEDLMQRDHNANSLLLVAARRQELKKLFSPKLWAGHVNDMKTLWAQLPVEFKGQVNWAKTLNQTNIETLHLSKKNGQAPLKRRR